MEGYIANLFSFPVISYNFDTILILTNMNSYISKKFGAERKYSMNIP